MCNNPNNLKGTNWEGVIVAPVDQFMQPRNTSIFRLPLILFWLCFSCAIFYFSASIFFCAITS